jgi:hypothetical protein
MKKLALLFLTTGLLIACEDPIDYTIPDPGDKLVIDTRIVAGEPIRATVSQSAYSLGNNQPQILEDCRVAIFEEDVFLETLIFDRDPFGSAGFYVGKALPSNNKNYRIEMSHASLPEAKALVRVLDSAVVLNSQWNSATQEVTFELDPSIRAYYRVSVRQEKNREASANFISTISPGLEFFNFGDGLERSYGNIAYINNTLSSTTFKYALRLEDTTNLGPNFFYLLVERIDEAYYRHEKTKQSQGSQGFNDGLFSEPVQVYSNVEGGYGIVATSAPTFVKIRTQ